MTNDLLSYNKFRAGSAWLIFLLGVGLYGLGYFLCPSETVWKEIVLKIADVLVIGVLIGYLSNAAQFLGVFKTDLENIVYGKKFMASRNDLPQLWENLSL